MNAHELGMFVNESLSEMPATARVITRRHRSGKAKTKRTMSPMQRTALATGQTVTASRERAALMTRNVV